MPLFEGASCSVASISSTYDVSVVYLFVLENAIRSYAVHTFIALPRKVWIELWPGNGPGNSAQTNSVRCLVDLSAPLAL